ncbi:organic solute transporter subunit alpha-like [Amphiura filiformis]|uniref:organic solute transporter subunit alpha-like n=1 Tax=Amphiura filiformis TaxID=82378 RepID=UPI003B20E0F0
MFEIFVDRGSFDRRCRPLANSTPQTAGEVLDDMFEHPTMIVILATTTLFTIVTLALLIESVHHVAKHVPRSGVANHRINTVWMLALYPVFSALHLPGVWIPWSSSFCTTIATIVYSVSLYKFLVLVVDYYGGHRKMLLKLKTTEIQFPVTAAPLTACCCCFKKNCMRPRRLTKKSKMVLNILVLQVAFIRPGVNFVIALFNLGNIARWDSPITGMTIVMVSSTLIAMTALNCLYTGSAETLTKYHLRAKFYLIKAGLMFGNLQLAVFRILANYWVLPCIIVLPFELRAGFWQCICIIYESFFLFLISRKYYRFADGNVVGKPAPLPDILDDTERGAAFKLRNMARRISSAF